MRRALPWVAVALAHLLLVWLLALALRPAPRPLSGASAAHRTLWLRVLPKATPPTPEPRTAEKRPLIAVPQPLLRHDALPAAQSPATTMVPVPAQPQAITAPLPASAPSAPPLELRLAAPPTRGTGALAREDARLGQHAPTGGERMARALGTDLTLREEAAAEGVQRFRRGNQCIMTRQARDAQLDPYNQSARPIPRLAGNC